MIKILNKILFCITSPFLTEEQQFDYQLKRQFKPKKFPKKTICKDCKIEIKNPIDYWVDGNGNVEYECDECKKINFWKNHRLPSDN